VTNKKKTEPKEGRDHLGRWLKRVSGNLKGPPRQMVRLEHGDFVRFKNETMLVDTPDGPVAMTREAAILHRLYQSAMKGSVHAQIFLTRRIDKHYMDKVGIYVEFHRIWSEIKRQNRMPTDEEWDLISGAMDHLDPVRRYKDGPQMVHASQFRRGKRKPKIKRPRGNPDD
jgi:hypothetical protein